MDFQTASGFSCLRFLLFLRAKAATAFSAS